MGWEELKISKNDSKSQNKNSKSSCKDSKSCLFVLKTIILVAIITLVAPKTKILVTFIAQAASKNNPSASLREIFSLLNGGTMLPKKRGDFLFAGFAAGDGKNQRFQGGVLNVVIDAVEFQEKQGDRRSCPLVSIQKRVVANDMEKISRCHRVKIAVHQGAAKRRLRHRESGFQKPHVPNATRTAEQFDWGFVDLENPMQF
jgi:hypothetical protein